MTTSRSLHPNQTSISAPRLTTKRPSIAAHWLGLALCISMPAYANDLLQIYRLALNADATYASARSQYLATQEKLPQARAGLLPTLNLTGSSSFTDGTVQPRDGRSPSFDRNFNSNTLAISLSQPLFRWSNWESYEQSKLVLMQSEAALAQARQDLTLKVAQAYFDILSSMDSLDVIAAKKTAITEQLEQAKRNFQVGAATITDQQEAQARYDLALAEELAAQNDLANKRSALQQLIGQGVPEKLASLKPVIDLTPPKPAEPANWIQAAEQQSLGVMAANAGVAIAKRTIAINRAGHYPNLDLTGSVARNSQTASTISATGTIINQQVIGINLTVPLYAGGGTESKVREAVALHQKAQDDLLVAKRSAALTTQQAYNGVMSGLAQVRALEAAEKSSLLALDANKLGYKVGVRINIDVLNAQQQVFTTRRDLLKARYSTILSGLSLKAASGNLQEADLAEVNQLLVKPGAQ
ncbi:TolC family outer membrane protein [Parvibium lacunae]|uniref:Channel protein TolC n=1 Tax=Parvibium lacunae TaxID=1888893 RepID=A0A368L1G3_9BURK|nr:TolC family outer membrane protein [Parvibium lacunae]RCS57395.1 channel protein TolC [Parvibium lacunae]